MSSLDSIELLQWSFITQQNLPTLTSEVSSFELVNELSSKLANGQFLEIITNPGFSFIFNQTPTEDNIQLVQNSINKEDATINETYISLKAYQLQVKNATENWLKEDNINHILLLILSIALLNYFVQVGWTGPEMNADQAKEISEVFKVIYPNTEDFTAKKSNTTDAILRDFSVEGEDAYHLAISPALLWYSETLLSVLVPLGSTKSSNWWLSRALFFKQRLLDNPTETLKNTIYDLLKPFIDSLPTLESTHPDYELFSDLGSRLWIELGLHNHLFYQDQQAVECYDKSKEWSGLQYLLTGALGKRTKYQQRDISQLVLWAKSRNSNEQTEKPKLPETLALNDDTIMESIKFAENPEDEEFQKEISNPSSLAKVDQCILLAYCLNIKNTNPDHGITNEQMVPYVTRVLAHPNNWMIHTMGLVLRSRLESTKSRTVERSVFQLQALVDQWNVTDSQVTERLEHIHSLLLPSKWEMEKELAERFMSLGIIRSALEIYQKLELWEQVINCHLILEREDHAKAVIEEQLALNPNSPKLLCLKGDATQDPAWYHRAWDVSGQRYARAMRSLGSYYFKRNEFNSSVGCYVKALTINPLFEQSWYLCGCAAMQCEDYEVAAKAFRQVISIDDENAEAWNNLASIYLKLNQKKEAFLAFKQALKRKFENWKIWTNYMYTSLDMGYIGEAIRAFEKIVDLRWQDVKEDCVDQEILGIFIDAVLTDKPDSKGQGSGRYAPQLESLLKNTILTRIVADSGIWKLYARLLLSKQRYAEALECQVKAYRAISHKADLTTNPESFKIVSESLIELVDSYQSLGSLPAPTRENPDAIVCADWNYQSRMLLRNLIAKTKNSYEGDQAHNLLVSALEDLPPANKVQK
ncbi:TPR-like protein [Conidiobolus coronatus NRRL 28638]|uniref:TPR-like protein n=1 Tax=Conidiobolus coronatus (strain ATCC 28846 / CBS 209.66 / NRRL 28638) TaxID=796925 RepID=A0A137P652_CONC2|nr:TPR-like protein [Conidiobolus coronatus NRRL 28638]|eukprot:KXN70466.1 TPR-like protein [Conidiobolus coronatus NRRL 28638]